MGKKKGTNVDFGLNTHQKSEFNKAIRCKGIKMCWACSTVMGLECFSGDSRGGLKSKCRDCANSAGRSWYGDNRDHRNKVARGWQLDNLGRVAENGRRWRDDNRERKAETDKRWAEDNPARVAEYMRRYREANPKDCAARDRLNGAVRYGRIVRPGSCSDCGTECVPHGHHEDYDKPLDVIWLCPLCHKAHHAGGEE